MKNHGSEPDHVSGCHSLTERTIIIVSGGKKSTVGCLGLDRDSRLVLLQFRVLLGTEKQTAKVKMHIVRSGILDFNIENHGARSDRQNDSGVPELANIAGHRL
jgi:hypothetical protein